MKLFLRKLFETISIHFRAILYDGCISKLKCLQRYKFLHFLISKFQNFRVLERRLGKSESVIDYSIDLLKSTPKVEDGQFSMTYTLKSTRQESK